MNEEKPHESMTDAQTIELEMKRLQCEKLRVEIRDASLAWWQRPNYIASTVPIILAVAGVFSGWASGFFNRERALLQSDIDNLTTAKATLTQDVETAQQELTSARERAKQAQKFIDEVYVKVSFYSSGTRYTLSHVKPEGQEAWVSANDIAAAAASLTQLPPEDRERLERVLEQYRIVIELIDSVHASMKDVDDLLSALPASERVKRLQLTVDPDYDFIDPATKKTYSIETIEEFLNGTD